MLGQGMGSNHACMVILFVEHLVLIVMILHTVLVICIW